MGIILWDWQLSGEPLGSRALAIGVARHRRRIALHMVKETNARAWDLEFTSSIDELAHIAEQLVNIRLNHARIRPRPPEVRESTCTIFATSDATNISRCWSVVD